IPARHLASVAGGVEQAGAPPEGERAERPVYVGHLWGPARPLEHVVVLVPGELGDRARDVPAPLVPAGPQQVERGPEERIGLRGIAETIRLKLGQRIARGEGQL